MKREKYFTLNKNCFLIKGAKRGAIYDLESGNVFSVNEVSVKILEELDSWKEFKQVFQEDKNITEGKLVIYLNKLKKLGLGEWSEIYREKLNVIPKPIDVLKFVLHLELTTGCNLCCVHCYNESEITKFRKNNNLSLNEWKRIIKEAYEIGCRRVQFIGGEPFLKRRLLYTSILLAREIGYTSIEVSTNGTLITEKDLDFLKENTVSLAFSVYSYNSNVHDAITAKKGSQKQTLRTIKRALEMDINFRISVVAMRQNEKEIKKTVKFLKSLGIQHVKTNTVEPVGRGCNDNLITADIVDQQILDRPSFFKINYNTFWRNKLGHNCFLEHICIAADGNIYPCLAEREISYGNIKSTPLNEIFSSEIAQNFRNLNKDYIEVCRDCEYRYCCFDCRVKARDSLINSFYTKSWWCFYDPYKGQWHKKIN